MATNKQFDEQFLIDLTKRLISDKLNTTEIKSLFGNRKVKYYDSTTQANEKPQFPCFIVNIISAFPATNYNTADDPEHFTDFSMEIEHYNQAVGSNTKEFLGRKLNMAVKSALQGEYPFHITYNSEIPNGDETVYRRLIRCNGIFDNYKQILYR